MFCTMRPVFLKDGNEHFNPHEPHVYSLSDVQASKSEAGARRLPSQRLVTGEQVPALTTPLLANPAERSLQAAAPRSRSSQVLLRRL